MTVTAPGCLRHDVMTKGVRAAMMTLLGVERVDVELRFDPPWLHTRMSSDPKRA